MAHPAGNAYDCFLAFPRPYRLTGKGSNGVDLTRFTAPFGYDRYLRKPAVHDSVVRTAEIP